MNRRPLHSHPLTTMSEKTTTTPESPLDSNYFAVALSHMDFGSLLPALSEDLTTLVKEVHANGRPGSLTLTLKIKPAGTRGQVEITADTNLKRPKADPSKSLFFATEHGQLLRSDPRQKEFPFAEDEDAPRKAVIG